MHYQLIPPRRELAPYVKSFWILEGRFSEQPMDTYRLMANAFPEMTFHYENQFQDSFNQTLPFASFDGPAEKFKEFSLKGHFGMVGVCFYPYAVQPIFNVSIKELTDRSIGLATVLGKEGRELAERVISAADNAQRLAILSKFLCKKIGTPSSIDPDIYASLKKTYAKNGALSMDEITKDVWLSRRQFERKFNEWVGVRPKLLTRIVRFQTSLKMKKKPFRNLSSLAQNCGYFDQSHFIRDFKAFAGMSPRVYFKKIEESADNFVNLSGTL